MRPKVTQLYQVYLLHFDEPVRHASHYMGICKSARLHWRMLEHQRGVGASLTAEVAALGVGFSLVCTWFTDSPAIERELKDAKGFKKHCPICSPTADLERKRLVLKHYPPLLPRLPFETLDIERQPKSGRYQK